MKQVLLIAAIVLSVSVSAQVKSGSPEVGKTESKKEPVDTAYYLAGSRSDFQLLYKQLASPGDVTPNQLNALIAWMNKIQMMEVPKKKN
jgi:hypothetical protein